MIATPNCHKRGCKHYLGTKNDGEEDTERVYCKAFPNKIPSEISYNGNKHLKVLSGQKNDIIFEKQNTELKKSIDEKSPQLKALDEKEELAKSMAHQKLLKEKRKRRKKRKHKK